MNIAIWVQYDTIATPNKVNRKSLLKSALTVLDNPNIVAVVESTPMPINNLNAIDKSELVNIDCDLILVTGHDVDLAPILAEAKELGLDIYKFVLDRTVCLPGFTPEKHKQLRKSNLSILSMGWWAGIAYHNLGLPILSPTINMYTSEEDFMNFLPEARWNFKKDLCFDRTKHNPDLNIDYPIFCLDDVQWFMNGFLSEATALKAWNERKNKINWSNVLVTMHTSNPAVLERFDCLPYEKKVCFVPFETDLDSGFYVDATAYEGNILYASEAVIAGDIQAYDVWDLLLHSQKTPIK